MVVLASHEEVEGLEGEEKRWYRLEREVTAAEQFLLSTHDPFAFKLTGYSVLPIAS
jgi:hypothetical protein